MHPILRCIASPIELCIVSFRIYVLPCICGISIPWFRRCCLYSDDEFNENALGCEFEANKANIEWRRCYDIPKRKFISQHITPSDLIQGGIGDCWLISAMSCLAEHHGALHRLFDSRRVSVLGKYTVNLYNSVEKKWVKITIDDQIPYMKNQNKPIFAQCQDNEIWPLLLEKAFAKFVGDYSKLKGGSIAWGLQALTGDNVMRFSQKERVWSKLRMVNMNGKIDPKSVAFIASQEKYEDEHMFEIFKEYDHTQSVLAAYIAHNCEWKRSNGIVAGHAYSVLRVEEIGNTKLLQLRNPWGKFEWNGEWSDTSVKWKENPYIRMRLGFEKKEDGVFWMSWFDFQTIFTDVDVCHRSTGIHDLVLDIHEGVCCGSTIGCVKGCSHFWCCCAGCKALYFPQKSERDTLKVKKSCVLL